MDHKLRIDWEKRMQTVIKRRSFWISVLNYSVLQSLYKSQKRLSTRYSQLQLVQLMLYGMLVLAELTPRSKMLFWLKLKMYSQSIRALVDQILWHGRCQVLSRLSDFKRFIIVLFDKMDIRAIEIGNTLIRYRCLWFRQGLHRPLFYYLRCWQGKGKEHRALWIESWALF